MSITIEEMNKEADWSQVQKLLQSTPMTASIPLAASRLCSPEFAYPVIRGKIFDLVAKKDGKVVGFIHGRLEEKMAYHDGKFSPVQSAYIGDLRVDSSVRRLGVGSQLGLAVKKYFIDHDIKYGWGAVFANNKPMINFYDRITHKVQSVRNYSVASRLIMAGSKKQKTNYSYESFVPTTYDLEVLAKKLGHRFLGPAVSGADLVALCCQYPEIRFYRRKSEGEIVFALWNQSRFRRLLLTEMPFFIRILRWVWNFLGLFTGAHPFPNAGESWCSAELTFVVEKKLATDFEAFVVAEAYDLGCHTLNIIEGGLGGDYPEIKVKGPAYRADLKLMSYSTDEWAPLSAPQFVMADVDLGFV